MTQTTGLGSLPGTDVAGGLRLALEDASLPWLPEFPARGPWAGLVGRSLGLLAGLGAELSAGEWRLASASGLDQRRARAGWRDDLDRLQEVAPDLSGPLKVGMAGPWTLAASVFRPLGGRVLADRGARRDLAQSLAEGALDLLGGLARRWPGLEPLIQVDEPSLPAVLAGRVPTEGGYFRHRAVDAPEVAQALRWLTGLGVPAVVHCCAAGVPVALLTTPGPDGAGFTGVSLDGALVDRPGWEALGAAVERGTTLFLGVLDADGPAPRLDDARQRVLDWLRPLELGPRLAGSLVLTHTCGLAGTPVADVRPRLELLRRLAEQVDESLRA